MLEKGLNYISILFTENDITISLSYEEAINAYPAKNVEKKVLSSCVRKAMKSTVLIFWFS